VNRLPRIFYCAWTPPNKISGATLAMRRHFIEHDDLELFVATSCEFNDPEIPSLIVRTPSWLNRIRRTRFMRIVQNFEYLIWSQRLPAGLLQAAETFQPDAIFTVADMTLSESARQVAERLKIPLITNFQDWWPRGLFYYPQNKPYDAIVPILEKRFRRLYKESALAYCTSKGMKEFLGTHPNSHVLYPIGAQDSPENTESLDEPSTTLTPSRPKKRLIYTGTAFGSYGQMLRSLARELKHSTTWELVIFGVRPDWPEAEIMEAEESGLYRGFLPFEQLKMEFASADACLSVMSFDKKLEVMMRTSFTTKLLDYCKIGRPIIMWGPEYCSPVKLTREHDAAITVSKLDATEVVKALSRMDSDPELVKQLSTRGRDLGNSELSHEKIHTVFTEQINRLVSKN